MALIRCPKCGKESVSSGAAFCVFCGGRLAPGNNSAMYCADCGAELCHGETVCPRCGCPVEQAKEAAPVLADTSPSPEASVQPTHVSASCQPAVPAAPAVNTVEPDAVQRQTEAPKNESVTETALTANAVKYNEAQQQTEALKPERAVIQAAPSVKCAECGAELCHGETVCPRCGCPVEQAKEAAPVLADTFPSPEASAQPARASAACQPAVPAAPAANDVSGIENAAGEKSRKRITAYNIYALLSMIYPTIVFFGDVFTLKIGKSLLEFPFGFLKFAEVNEKIRSNAWVLSIFDDQLAKDIESFSATLEIVKYIFIAIVIYTAFRFIKGWFEIGKGKLIMFAFVSPLIYYAVMWLFCIAMGVMINSTFGEGMSENISAAVNAQAAPILVTGIINLVLSVIFQLVEGQK